MKDSEVKIGMKVKVKSKSVGSSYDSSVSIERAFEKGHDYLYVVGYDYEDGYWILSEKRFSKNSMGEPNGDFFLAKDFSRYNK